MKGSTAMTARGARWKTVASGFEISTKIIHSISLVFRTTHSWMASEYRAVATDIIQYHLYTSLIRACCHPMRQPVPPSQRLIFLEKYCIQIGTMAGAPRKFIVSLKPNQTNHS
jgi:hypothetical protein